MKYITVEHLLKRKQELIEEREDKLRTLVVGYDNAIAILDELIKTAMESEEGEINERYYRPAEHLEE